MGDIADWMAQLAATDASAWTEEMDEATEATLMQSPPEECPACRNEGYGCTKDIATWTGFCGWHKSNFTKGGLWIEWPEEGTEVEIGDEKE